MKRSSIIESRRKSVNPEVRRMVESSLQIVDRIHDNIETKGMAQKDLSTILEKKLKL